MEQNTKDWLNWRKIGSSDCPIILGISPYKTPYELYQERLGLIEAKEPSVAMLKGKETEAYIRAEFERQIGMTFKPACLESESYEWMTASLDGLNENGDIFAEFKMNNEAHHAMARLGEIVDHHYAQVMHQWIVGRDHIKRGYYVSWHNGDVAIVEIELNEILQATIIKEEKEFWECLQNKTPPELIDRDYAEIDNQDIRELLDMYNITVKEEKKAAEMKDRLKDQIILMCGNRNARIGSQKVTKIVRQGSVDYAKIPELKTINLDSYRKADIVSWRIS